MVEDDTDPEIIENPRGFLAYPTDHVYAFVEDPDTNVPKIIGELISRNVGTEAITIYRGRHGIDNLSPSGASYGVSARIRRMFHWLGYEGEHLRHVEQELEAGEALVGVSVEDDETKETVAGIFRDNGGHHIRFYARFHIEHV